MNQSIGTIERMRSPAPSWKMKAGIIFAIILCVVNGQVQDSEWYEPTPSNDVEDEDDTEKRFTTELATELQSAKDDALLLYTEYSARNGAELKVFLKTLASFSNETLQGMGDGLLDNAPSDCRQQLQTSLKKIEYDAHRAASFSAENHHKYLRGHMVVLRMHLNKSEEYIKKCDREIQNYGPNRETSPRMVRWRRQALDEIHRVRDDMLHSRKSYKDLLLHVRRKLKQLRRKANARAQDVLQSYRFCTKRAIGIS